MKYTYQLDYKKLPNGKILSVSHKESGNRLSEIPAKILDYMMARVGEEIDKNDICSHIWGDSHYFIHRSFDVHLKKVRDFLKQTDAPFEIPRSNRMKLYLFEKNG